MSVNRDKDVPRSEEAPRFDLSPEAFLVDPKGVHIFWGPDQLMTNYPEYTPPNVDGWRKEYLNIPKVGRFIYAAGSEYNTDNYPDPDGGGGGSTVQYFEIVNILVRVPPFPRNIMVYTTFGTTVSRSPSGAYSIDPAATAYYSIGLKYRFTVPSTAAIDYYVAFAEYRSRDNGYPAIML